jgi:hypothetical protein
VFINNITFGRDIMWRIKIKIIKRFLILFDIKSCIICGKYRYKAPFTLSGGGVICKYCLPDNKPDTGKWADWRFWDNEKAIRPGLDPKHTKGDK